MHGEAGGRERAAELLGAPVAHRRPRCHGAVEDPREPALDDRMRVDVLDQEPPAPRQAGAQGAGPVPGEEPASGPSGSADAGTRTDDVIDAEVVDEDRK